MKVGMKMWRGQEGKRCGVKGCRNAARKQRSKMRLFGLPRVRVPHSCEADRLLTKSWRAAWVAALNAAGNNCENNFLRTMMVCSRHFVSGNPANFRLKDNVDWAPTLHMSGVAEKVGQSRVIRLDASKKIFSIRRVPNSNRWVMARKSVRPTSMMQPRQAPNTADEEAKVELKPCIVQLDRKQVDEYLKLSGKTLDELLPCPSMMQTAVCFEVESGTDEEIIPEQPPAGTVYQSATTGRVRKCPERLQVSHSASGPKMNCPMCQVVIYSKRSLTFHMKVCKNRPGTQLDVDKPVEESDEFSEASDECPVSKKRPKPSADKIIDAVDSLDELAIVSDESSEVFSESSDEYSEWDEVDSVEIKMEHEEDSVKLQNVGIQTDVWCPTTPTSFFCMPCHCQFRTSVDLRQHGLDVHRESADSTLSSLGGRPAKGIKMVKFVSGVSCFYECPYCRTLRVDVAQLLRHMRQQHPSRLTSTSITCRKAPVKMMKSVRLDVIREQQYLCGYCRMLLDSLKLLKLHLEKSHLVRECIRCISFFQATSNPSKVCTPCLLLAKGGVPSMPVMLRGCFPTRHLPLSMATKIKAELRIANSLSTNSVHPEDTPLIACAQPNSSSRHTAPTRNVVMFPPTPPTTKTAPAPPTTIVTTSRDVAMFPPTVPTTAVVATPTIRATPTLRINVATPTRSIVVATPIPPAKATPIAPAISITPTTRVKVVTPTGSIFVVPPIAPTPAVAPTPLTRVVPPTPPIIKATPTIQNKTPPPTIRVTIAPPTRSVTMVPPTTIKAPPTSPTIVTKSTPTSPTTIKAPPTSPTTTTKAAPAEAAVVSTANLLVAKQQVEEESIVDNLQQDSEQPDTNQKRSTKQEPEVDEDEMPMANSDDEDNYGVDALEQLLQKLKPKAVQNEPKSIPCPSRKWKIELPKLQDNDDLSGEKVVEVNEVSDDEQDNGVYSRSVLPSDSWIRLPPAQMSSVIKVLDRTLGLRPGRFEHLPRRLAPCLMCPKVSESYELLSQHMLSSHSYCPVCRCVRPDQRGHLKGHQQLKFFRCSFFGCVQTFFSPEHCLAHEFFVHDCIPPVGHELTESQRLYPFRPDDPDALHCFYCAEYFETLPSLEKHLSDAHKVSKCPDCCNFYPSGRPCIVCAQN